MTLTIRAAYWEQDKSSLRAIREQVFVEEQSVPIELEWDEHDEIASHWLAFINDEPVATVRMLNDGHIGRMAVLKQQRGLQIGQQLLHTVLDECRQRQLLETYLYAQTHAIPFYEKMGFHCIGDEFMDAGIPHRKMQLTITDKRLLGQHGGRFAIHNIRQATQDLIEQCERQLLVLSFDLDPTIYDQQDIIGAISKLARKSRYTEIKLLIVDSKRLVRRGHGLLNLSRRLSSAIEIRKTTADLKDLPQALVIADLRGIIGYDLKDPDAQQAWGNYNNKPAAEALAAEFDILWQRANQDRELKVLGIS